MSGEQYVWAINQRLSTCCLVSDVNPVQKDVSASKNDTRRCDGSESSFTE